MTEDVGQPIEDVLRRNPKYNIRKSPKTYAPCAYCGNIDMTYQKRPCPTCGYDKWQEKTFHCPKCGGAVKKTDKKCPHCEFTPPPRKPKPKNSFARRVDAGIPLR